MKGKIVYGNPIRYYVDGNEVSKEEFDEAFPTKPLTYKKCATTLMETSNAWPMRSNSLGVHPKQCKEAEAFAAKLGVPTEFDKKTGEAIFRNNAHKRDFAKAHHYPNRDGGFGTITG